MSPRLSPGVVVAVAVVEVVAVDVVVTVGLTDVVADVAAEVVWVDVAADVVVVVFLEHDAKSKLAITAHTTTSPPRRRLFHMTGPTFDSSPTFDELRACLFELLHCLTLPGMLHTMMTSETGLSPT
ncbi:MAG TPA: hypothetical protein VJL08_01825 [Dehalococcoidia bacterium]|nr:hypothetical protein [Dehalococcoidia bacterium]